MLYYFRKYPVSLIIVAIIFYLSFFTPPKTDVEEIPYIDKVVHICMYGGLCFILWIEYLRNHKAINWNHVIWGGIIAPVAMSGCIELMQAYCTDTRSGDWLDFLANSIGVGLAALIGDITYFAPLYGVNPKKKRRRFFANSRRDDKSQSYIIKIESQLNGNLSDHSATSDE